MKTTFCFQVFALSLDKFLCLQLFFHIVFQFNGIDDGHLVGQLVDLFHAVGDEDLDQGGLAGPVLAEQGTASPWQVSSALTPPSMVVRTMYWPLPVRSPPKASMPP